MPEQTQQQRPVIQRLVRGQDGRLRVILIDLETLQQVQDYSPDKYRIINNFQQQAEPVQNVDEPDPAPVGPAEDLPPEYLNRSTERGLEYQNAPTALRQQQTTPQYQNAPASLRNSFTGTPEPAQAVTPAQTGSQLNPNIDPNRFGYSEPRAERFGRTPEESSGWANVRGPVTPELNQPFENANRVGPPTTSLSNVSQPSGTIVGRDVTDISQTGAHLDRNYVPNMAPNTAQPITNSVSPTTGFSALDQRGQVAPSVSTDSRAISPVRDAQTLSDVSRQSQENVQAREIDRDLYGGGARGFASLDQASSYLDRDLEEGGGMTFDHANQTGIRDNIRDALTGTSREMDRSLGINSGYRDPAYNKEVGGARGSFHQSGKAVDVDMTGWSPEERQDFVREMTQRGAGGFITYTNTPNALHVDMRSTPTGSPHFMHDRTARKMEQAPDWFKESASYGGINPPKEGPQIAFRDDLESPMVAANDPRDMATSTPNTPDRYTGNASALASLEGVDVNRSPAALASAGYLDRTPRELADIGFAIAGELTPEQLSALEQGNPATIKEIENMVSTIENRANSTKYGSLEKTLNPTDYTSLMQEKLSTTTAHFSKYQDQIMDVVSGFYSSGKGNAMTNYHADYANPGWSSKLADRNTIDRHTFGIDNSYRYSTPESAINAYTRDQINRQTSGINGGFTPDYERFNGGFGGMERSYSGRGGYDSPSEGGSRFGGSGLDSGFAGSRSESTRDTGYGGSSNHSAESTRDTSLGGGSTYGGNSGRSESTRDTSNHSAERERDTSVSEKSETNHDRDRERDRSL